MNKLAKSKLLAWCVLVIIVIIMFVTFDTSMPWWSYVSEFFAFMMAFTHLLAVNFYKLNSIASSKLEKFAILFGVLMILAIIVEYIVFNTAFSL